MLLVKNLPEFEEQGFSFFLIRIRNWAEGPQVLLRFKVLFEIIMWFEVKPSKIQKLADSLNFTLFVIWKIPYQHNLFPALPSSSEV